MRKGSLNTGGSNSPKLSHFMQRTSSSTKPNEQFAGTISFNTKHDEDISGLDEAMQTFRASTGSSVNVKGHGVAADTKESATINPTNDGALTSEFEVAVEATAIAVDPTNPMEQTDDGSTPAFSSQPYFDIGDVSISSSVRQDHMGLEYDSGLDKIADDDLDLRNPGIYRGSPFDTQSNREKGNVVAASEIHALLDSFAPTGHASVDRLSQKVNTEHDSHETPVSVHQATLPETDSTREETLVFSMENDAQPAYDGDAVIRPHRPDDSPTHDIIQDSAEVSTVHRRTSSPQTHMQPSETAAPKIPSFQSHTRIPSRKRASSTTKFYYYSTCLISLLIIIGASFYLVNSFLWGVACGVTVAYAFVYGQRLIWGDTCDEVRCPISGSPLGVLCCSLHHQLAKGIDVKDHCWPIYSPALPFLNGTRSPPQLRDLQTFSVPRMNDEDPGSSASTGPLATGLGFKLNKNDHPVYKGWMNETGRYNPETHHVSQTHSVFVTLDGTQLRLQRPRKNIARRSMWNEELPSTSTVRFQRQRIFDLVHARVSLLPSGLVFKRLWSKKYPIAITIPKTRQNIPGSRPNLLSSTSVPNMAETLSNQSSPARTDAGPRASGRPHSRSPTPAELTETLDDFTVLSYRDVQAETLYLFGRTCREKETWYARLRAASLGIPLLWTPQLAVQSYLATTGCVSASSASITASGSVDNRSDEDSVHEKDAPLAGSENGCDKPSFQGPLIPGSREPLYVTYVRYMAKFMPASWLLRGAQALRLNVNYVNCDSSVLWLNALLGRVFWDFLREVYWLKRVRDKIQAKLKKIHLPPFISDLIVVGIDLGSELPVIRRIGKPFLDAQGLWFELDVAYAGGFSVALETNVNLMRWNQKTREATNLADDISSTSPTTQSNEQNYSTFGRRTNRLGAFISDEEDSADSTTDSDSFTDGSLSSNLNLPGIRRSSNSGRLLGSSGNLPGSTNRNADEERPSGSDSPSGLPSRRRLVRIVDRITRSTYFQKAVDNKLVQRGMELLSNTPIVLEAEIQMLTGTLLINIPPPPSDRLWYGFRPNPQLRLKARPRVGEKAVTMTRILDWIENRVILEFQRLIVLPNMDDISIPLLLSDVTAG